VVTRSAPTQLGGMVVEMFIKDSRQPSKALQHALLAHLYNHYRSAAETLPGDFTGYAFFYTADYRYLAGTGYVKGKALAGKMRLTRVVPVVAVPPKSNSTANKTTSCTLYLIKQDTSSSYYENICQSEPDFGGADPDPGQPIFNDPGYGGVPSSPTTGNGGTSTGGGTNPASINPADVYLYDGQKPLGEYADKCSGVQALWNLGVSNNNAETVGVITGDGHFLVVAIVGQMGGAWGGLYHFDSGVGAGVDYYQWPDSQGAPTQNYVGMIQSSGHYFIPIVATIHSHTPCLSDGTNGISNMTLSTGDQNLAANFTNISHYIVGCGALGTFNSASTSPSVRGTGPLSTTCSLL